jgi:hypothetical protein
MIKQIIALILLLQINSCAPCHKTLQDNNTHIAIKELTHGITRGQISKKANVIQGNTTDGELLKKTNKIPALLGNQFGILFVVESNQLVALPIEIEWILPKTFVNHRGERTKHMRTSLMCTARNPFWANYGLDLPNEVIKGKWICRIYYKGMQLYQKRFRLY